MVKVFAWVAGGTGLSLSWSLQVSLCRALPIAGLLLCPAALGREGFNAVLCSSSFASQLL